MANKSSSSKHARIGTVGNDDSHMLKESVVLARHSLSTCANHHFQAYTDENVLAHFHLCSDVQVHIITYNYDL